MADQLNLLLICVDQWRADCLGCEGHPVVQTPQLDLLASQGARFRRAYAACPTCIPARASLFTGLTPARHGFVGYRDGVRWEYPVTLPRTLGEAGYQTQCVGKMHVYPYRNTIGFHDVRLHDGYLHHSRREMPDVMEYDDYLPWLRERTGNPQADYLDTGISCNGYVYSPWCYADELHPSAWVTSESIDFLRRRDRTRPFFLMASYHRPHPPLDPPASIMARYLGREVPEPVIGDWVDHPLPVSGSHDSPIPTRPADIAEARRAYYAQLTFIDLQLNRLIHALYARQLLDNTAILFVSDHGEMLYDHNQVAKAMPYEASARIPFLLKLPPSMSVRRGLTVDHPVEIRDIFPTLCDLAGIPAPAGLEGRSVVPLARGEDPGWRDVLHGEHLRDSWSNQWLTDGREKYIWFTQTGREQLFDLVADPTECHDLAAVRPERVGWWRQRLAAELAGRPEGFVGPAGALLTGRPQRATLDHAGRGA